MFNAARDLPCMDVLDKVIDVMKRWICACRKKYEQNDAFVILPSAGRIMNSQWEASAAISVMELEVGSGVCTMSPCDYDGGVDNEEDKHERKRKS